MFGLPRPEDHGARPGAAGQSCGFALAIRELFSLAWRIDPVQPLAADVWYGEYGTTTNDQNRAQYVAGALSDIVSYHCYKDFEAHVRIITRLKRHFQRPMINTEWLARTVRCDVFDNYPPAAKNKCGRGQPLHARGDYHLWLFKFEMTVGCASRSWNSRSVA